MRVAHDSSSAALVRQRLCEELQAAGLTASVVHEVVLVANELLANAIRHTSRVDGAPLEVTWTVDPAGVTVEVGDYDPGLPRERTPDPGQPGGRGLQIIDALSDGWGVNQRQGGKQVWAHIPRASGSTLA